MKKLVLKFQKSLHISKGGAIKRVIMFFFFALCIVATFAVDFFIVLPHSFGHEEIPKKMTGIFFFILLLFPLFTWAMFRCQRKLINTKIVDWDEAHYTYFVVWQVKKAVRNFFSLK